MRSGRKRNNESKLIADINVTPLVDVVLVLIDNIYGNSPDASDGYRCKSSPC